MIRQFQKSDTQQVMQIWLAGNEDAHPFIPKDYWRSHFIDVQQQLLLADVFVYEADGKIQGFMGIVNEYIAGIFVEKASRSGGIGRQLLEYAKQEHDRLSLGVYQKNMRAVKFYLREDFLIQSREIDEATGADEYTMIWEKCLTTPSGVC